MKHFTFFCVLVKTMSAEEAPGNENGDDKPPVSSTVEYSRTISQDLRYLDDALTHAIDQLTLFNSETMSDLSLKYELIRNNEVIFESVRFLFLMHARFIARAV